MCGLVGLFLPRNAKRLLLPNMDAALNSIRHRGPDGEGRWIASDKRFWLGFRRLAVIDLGTSNQPLISADGRHVLAGNGEIYNYQELRQRSEVTDYHYRTHGDMEVILPLVDKLKEAFVHELNGMYGLALYDKALHRLLLVRDRLGIKPLYWAQLASGGIVFASEIKAIFATGLISPCINEKAVSSYLSHGWVPAPQTLYAGVKKLLPGSTLSIDAKGTLKQTRYWRPKPSKTLPQDEIQIRIHLVELLRDSISLQLRSDVPIGALLSGGIDSSLLVALATEQMDTPLNTFTIRFPDTVIDESPFAQIVAERYGTRHQVVEANVSDVSTLLTKLAWFNEEPLFDAAALPNFLVEKTLAKHVTVALNGTGGDELFAGYGRYFLLPIERKYLKLPTFLRKGISSVVSPMRTFQLYRAEAWNTDRARYLHEHISHFPPPIRSLIGNTMPIAKIAQAEPFDVFDGPPDTAMLATDLETYLADDLMYLLDRTSMAVGVEGRVPFLDHRLVEAALAVPPKLRISNGQQKYLERLIAVDFLPKDLISAPKQGFVSPVPAWLRTGLGTSVKHILTSQKTLARGWWTKDGIMRLFKDIDRHGYRIYTLLMLELAVRIHVDGEMLEGLLDAA